MITKPKAIKLDAVQEEWLKYGIEQQSAKIPDPRKEDGWILGQEIAKIWGVSRCSVNRKLNNQLKNGEVERVKGHYSMGYYWRLKTGRNNGK